MENKTKIYRLLFTVISVFFLFVGCKKSTGFEPNPEIPDNDKMTLLYVIGESNSTVILPVTGTVDCLVEWGDGNTERVTDCYPSHVYEKTGSYTVKIAGTVSSMNSANLSNQERNYLVAIQNWGKIGLKSMQGAFRRYEKLAWLAKPHNAASLSEVETFASCFLGCTSLTKIPAGLFDQCSVATSFENTFSDCINLTAIPDGLFDECLNVTSFRSIFANCTSLTEIPSGLFGKCPEVLTFEHAFTLCSNLKEIPSGLFRGCNKASNFDNVFSGCTSLTSLPKHVFTSPEANFFRSAFENCENITKISEELFSRDHYAQYFDKMFCDCVNLKEIPDDLFQLCLGAENFTSTFAGCESLTEVPSGLFNNCKRVKSFITTFAGCINLRGESPYTLVDGKKCTFMNVTENQEASKNRPVTAVSTNVQD